MKMASMKYAMVIAAMLIVSLPGIGSAAEPCATVSVAISPSVVERGDVINVAASLNNCSSTTQRLTIRYELRTPCTRPLVFSVRVKVPPGVHSASITLPVFFFACPGDYTVTVTVLSGATVLSSSSATVTVL